MRACIRPLLALCVVGLSLLATGLDGAGATLSGAAASDAPEPLVGELAVASRFVSGRATRTTFSFRRLEVAASSATRNGRSTLSCDGRGCPFESRTLINRRAVRLALASLVGRRLHVGTRIVLLLDERSFGDAPTPRPDTVDRRRVLTWDVVRGGATARVRYAQECLLADDRRVPCLSTRFRAIRERGTAIRLALLEAHGVPPGTTVELRCVRGERCPARPRCWRVGESGSPRRFSLLDRRLRGAALSPGTTLAITFTRPGTRGIRSELRVSRTGAPRRRYVRLLQSDQDSPPPTGCAPA